MDAPLELLVEVEPDGLVRAMLDESLSLADLMAEGLATVRRASEIVPVGLVKRFAFRLLRLVFGESGRVAAWTRRWRGPWRVDLRRSGGPANAGEFVERAEALVWERRWLVQHGLRGA